MKIWKAFASFTCRLLVVGWLQQMAKINVTLAFGDVQVIPPFSMEDTDDRNDRDDADYTDDTDDIDDTDNSDDTDNTDDTG